MEPQTQFLFLPVYRPSYRFFQAVLGLIWLIALVVATIVTLAAAPIVLVGGAGYLALRRLVQKGGAAQ
ncbi:hypothetical protein HNQ92_002594 [Rhabdobacter roseus]|uniref:Uncharacterized protein n=1 Tax=Rhabdobacter roseus TaxID=1655419 RepID=A0A840TLK6_9BACT|nr:hypothetical protein [Rhabdobacter roseus]MBB5284451.1 hypothetical protein [Rhabdobacter roseus]